MAWEELLRLHDGKENSRPSQEPVEARDKGSLIQQVRDLIGESGGEPAAAAQTDGEARKKLICRDGYERRSPLQPYRTAEDFYRRRIRKAVTAVVVLILAALLLFALIRSGFLKFRFR